MPYITWKNASVDRKMTKSVIRQMFNWLKEPAISVGIVLVATTAIARPYYIPSGSMEPTLQIGDDVITAKFAYGYSRYSIPFDLGPRSDTRLLQQMPTRGDVVVFRLPRDPSQTLIKRVIGLPGDRIQMVQGRLWINGKKLSLVRDGFSKMQNSDGTYMEVPKYIETLPNGVKHAILKWRNFPPMDNTNIYVVPAGHLFMMGDNRDNSLDSRVAADAGGVGYVPIENLVGHAEIILGSVDYLNAGNILEWPAQVRIARLFKRIR
ncbi:MAG TPA: signal peptidase I [Rhizomicrobium sp.]|nr:signal peptidase I [Rhizomicrobium sp.]